MTWGNPPPFKSDPPRTSKPVMPEDLAKSGSEGANQKALMAWAALNVGKYPVLKLLFHIPNGGSRNIREAVELKAQGVKAGVPDLMLPCANGQWHGLFIELKIEKRRKEKNGGTSDEQIEWMLALAARGYFVKVCYGWIEAKETIEAYLEGRL